MKQEKKMPSVCDYIRNTISKLATDKSNVRRGEQLDRRKKKIKYKNIICCSSLMIQLMIENEFL